MIRTLIAVATGIALVMLLSGCQSLAGLSGLPLNLGHIGGKPKIVCTLKGKAELVQEGVAGISMAQPLSDADPLCAALKDKP